MLGVSRCFADRASGVRRLRRLRARGRSRDARGGPTLVTAQRARRALGGGRRHGRRRRGRRPQGPQRACDDECIAGPGLRLRLRTRLLHVYAQHLPPRTGNGQGRVHAVLHPQRRRARWLRLQLQATRLRCMVPKGSRTPRVAFWQSNLSRAGLHLWLVCSLMGGALLEVSWTPVAYDFPRAGFGSRGVFTRVDDKQYQTLPRLAHEVMIRHSCTQSKCNSHYLHPFQTKALHLQVL